MWGNSPYLRILGVAHNKASTVNHKKPRPLKSNVGRKRRNPMDVFNIHECEVGADPKQLGALLDSLASDRDRLWPKLGWPRMAFDRPLGVGAKGGHGPIRYFVEEYTPGESIKFRFTGPKGFDGFHGLEIVVGSEHSVVLRHTVKMDTHGLAILSWPLIYRPMHDALIEDSLTTAQVSLGLSPTVKPWSVWVKILRWVGSFWWQSGSPGYAQRVLGDVGADAPPHLNPSVRRNKILDICRVKATMPSWMIQR
jgi:hypothetical protein